MNDIKGTVRFYDKCGTCRSQFKNSVYKQILAADILHALLAKDTGCDILITFDKGFAALAMIGIEGSIKTAKNINVVPRMPVLIAKQVDKYLD